MVVFGAWIGRLFPSLIHTAAFGGWHGFGDLADKLFQSRDARRAKLPAGDGYVHVEVGGCVGEVVSVIFAPFSGADQAFLFGVPTADHDGALWFPAGLEKFA